VEHAFGRGRPFAIGMEEELLLVDSATHRLAPVSSELLGRVPEGEGSILQDVYEALVEITSPVSAHAFEGGTALIERRAALRAAGATLVGCGIHPDGAFGDAPHVPAERYRAIAGQMRGLLRRTPTCALHVHVGMPDPETAIRAFNRMRAHLPLLQGLAAHSPYWHGVDSGFETARAQLFRGYPRADFPRPFCDWEDYADTMTAFVQAADVPDYTFLWWDIRPHPNLGTIEIRAMDAQARPDSMIGLAGLVHALVLASTHEPDAPVPAREVLVESSFRAGRDGLDATIYTDGALKPLREVAEAALRLARPYARDLGAEDSLEGIERILREGNGALRMRDAHARGGFAQVLSGLVEETGRAL
jgi:carboxylate-amine ligase